MKINWIKIVILRQNLTNILDLRIEEGQNYNEKIICEKFWPCWMNKYVLKEIYKNPGDSIGKRILKGVVENSTYDGNCLNKETHSKLLKKHLNMWRKN